MTRLLLTLGLLLICTTVSASNCRTWTVTVNGRQQVWMECCYGGGQCTVRCLSGCI
jgi:hypothetical protein